MKLFLIQSYNYGSAKRVGEGAKVETETNAGDARREFRKETKRLKDMEVRFEVLLIIATADQPNVHQWRVFFEEGDFPHIHKKVIDVAQHGLSRDLKKRHGLS